MYNGILVIYVVCAKIPLTRNFLFYPFTRCILLENLDKKLLLYIKGVGDKMPLRAALEKLDNNYWQNERVKIKPLLTEADLITRCEKGEKCLQ